MLRNCFQERTASFWVVRKDKSRLSYLSHSLWSVSYTTTEIDWLIDWLSCVLRRIGDIPTMQKRYVNSLSNHIGSLSIYILYLVIF